MTRSDCPKDIRVQRSGGLCLSFAGAGVAQAMEQAQAVRVAISCVQFNKPFLETTVDSLPMTSVLLDIALPATVSPPITLTFAVTDPATAPGDNYTASCVWWQWAGYGGAWSTEGCTAAVANSTKVQCLCSHLTEFAVHLVPSPNVVSLEDFSTIPNHITQHPGLLILQCALVVVSGTLMVLGYVRDKRNQVCAGALEGAVAGRRARVSSPGVPCSGRCFEHRRVLFFQCTNIIGRIQPTFCPANRLLGWAHQPFPQ